MTDTRLALIQEYLRRIRNGEAVSPEAFLAEHPELGPESLPVLREAEEWSGDGNANTLQLRLEESGLISKGAAEIGPGDTREATAIWKPGQQQPGEADFDNRYKKKSLLGEGGYGQVFLVEDRMHDSEELALKVIRRMHTVGDLEQRFRNEIRVLRSLNHPGIPMIFNDGKTANGEIYYTMSYVEGRTLEEVIRDEAPLAPERIQRLGMQLLDVLVYAHEKGIVHRDLKPGNVILSDAGTPNEAVKVLDFGIAKILRHEGLLEQAQTMHTQMPIGTPHYMAPEQVRGLVEDGRTDVYSLGVIIYQMCSGRLPFQGTTSMQALIARLEQSPRELGSDEAPDWLRGLIQQLLEREQDKRPDAKAAKAALETGAFAAPARSARPKRWLAPAAVALAAAAGIAAWQVLGATSGDADAAVAAAPAESPSPGPDATPLPIAPGVGGESGAERPSGPAVEDVVLEPVSAPEPPAEGPAATGDGPDDAEVAGATATPADPVPATPSEPAPSAPAPLASAAAVSFPGLALTLEGEAHTQDASLNVSVLVEGSKHVYVWTRTPSEELVDVETVFVDPTSPMDFVLPMDEEGAHQALFYGDASHPRLDGADATPIATFVVVRDNTRPRSALEMPEGALFLETLSDDAPRWLVGGSMVPVVGGATDTPPGRVREASLAVDTVASLLPAAADGRVATSVSLADDDRDYRISLTTRDMAGNEHSVGAVLVLDTTPPDLVPGAGVAVGEDGAWSVDAGEEAHAGFEVSVSDPYLVSVTFQPPAGEPTVLFEAGAFEDELGEPRAFRPDSGTLAIGTTRGELVARDRIGNERRVPIAFTRLSTPVEELVLTVPGPDGTTFFERVVPLGRAPGGEPMAIDTVLPADPDGATRVRLLPRGGPSAEIVAGAGVAELEAAADGAPALVELGADGGSIEVRVLDHAGEPQLRYALAIGLAPTNVPAGCTRVPGSPVREVDRFVGRDREVGAEDGRRFWHASAIHDASGATLLFVPGRDGLEDFYVSRTEVTWRQYTGLTGAAGIEPPPVPDGATAEALGDHPVVNVSVDDAQAFCGLADGRLPTAEEWMWAASRDGSRYPWGDAADETACNNDGEDGWPGTCPVGRLAADRSWCGAQDMAGNVREWCMDDGRGTLAGGSFQRSIDRCVVDDPRGYTQRSDQVGFRFLVEARR